MRVSTRHWLPLALLLIASVALLGGCAFQPLLSGVSVKPERISPNADGQDDVTLIEYEIGRTALVSIYFLDGQGQRYTFREAERRSRGEYQVYWSGVTIDPELRKVEGGEIFRARVVQIAVSHKMEVTFLDPQLEAVRQSLGGPSQTPSSRPAGPDEKPRDKKIDISYIA